MNTSQPRRQAYMQGHRSGFTLLELLVVMVIIGLLVGYVAPRYFGQLSQSEINITHAQIGALAKALDVYRLDTGHYPAEEVGLQALQSPPANEPRWRGPYLDKAVPQDAWGNPYIYRQPGEQRDYDLVSLGKDGRTGGSDENADISN